MAVDTDLEWTAGAGAVSHDVYFGTTDPPPSIQNQTETIYDPGTLDNETTYYWRIDEIDSSTTHQGDVWSFTTFVPELPWSDDFESGSFADGGWTTSGNASVSSKAADTGFYGAEIKGTAWIEKAVSTAGFSNINIKYVCKTKGLDLGEYLYVEWYDGSDWHKLEETKNTDWSLRNLPCVAGANNAAFKVRFGTNASNSSEYAYVDDVEITENGELPTSGIMHVETIVVKTEVAKTAGPNEFIKAVATVTIFDADGVPVEGATVYGSWSGETSDNDSGLTNGEGIVTLESDQVKNGTTFTFTVDDVTKSGWDYDDPAEPPTGSIPSDG